jgi:hypothetical protein
LAYAQPFLVLGEVSSVGWTYLPGHRPRTGRISVTGAIQSGYVWHVSTIALKPPFADASPVEIRAALLPEDQPEFDRQWREALTVAAETLSLDEVHDTLESWRRIAWLVSEHGHEGYRRMMAQTQETLRTGQSPPGSVGIDEIEALIRARLSR